MGASLKNKAKNRGLQPSEAATVLDITIPTIYTLVSSGRLDRFGEAEEGGGLQVSAESVLDKIDQDLVRARNLLYRRKQMLLSVLINRRAS